LLYGNPDAKAPQYETDLTYSGKGPAWTIENSKIRVALRAAEAGADQTGMDYEYGDSGQLSAVVVKSRPDVEITNVNRVIHWNPGICIPKRGWMHSYAWNPPELYEIEAGPIYIEVRRAGAFPKIPEARLSITYRFFKERCFVWVGTRIDIQEDLGVMSLRNDQMVFDRPIFSHIAWEDEEGQLTISALDKIEPVNDHGDILRMGAHIPWLAVYNPATKVGAATVRLAEANVGPLAGPVTQFDHATYFSKGHGMEAFMYWFRAQDYFMIDWDRKQLITVPAGTVYAERNLYTFYDTEAAGEVDGIIHLARAARNQPDIKIGAFNFPPRR
jgi:hypothetical protein